MVDGRAASFFILAGFARIYPDLLIWEEGRGGLGKGGGGWEAVLTG
jgi:hypothetical protein